MDSQVPLEFNTVASAVSFHRETGLLHTATWNSLTVEVPEVLLFKMETWTYANV